MNNEKELCCPILKVARFIGDEWNLLILRDAGVGITRFEDFRKSLGISPAMLTKRLTQLTEEGIFEKRRYQIRPPRDEYVLTMAGRELLPVLLMLRAWSEKYQDGCASDRVVDAQTGETLRPVLIDANTGAEIGSREIRLVSHSPIP